MQDSEVSHRFHTNIRTKRLLNIVSDQNLVSTRIKSLSRIRSSYFNEASYAGSWRLRLHGDGLDERPDVDLSPRAALVHRQVDHWSAQLTETHGVRAAPCVNHTSCPPSMPCSPVWARAPRCTG